MPKEYSDVKSIFANLKMAKVGINKFKDETIIMATAGSSLDDNVQNLKRLQGRFKIFCVGSALRILMNNGIKPYMDMHNRFI